MTEKRVKDIAAWEEISGPPAYEMLAWEARALATDWLAQRAEIERLRNHIKETINLVANIPVEVEVVGFDFPTGKDRVQKTKSSDAVQVIYSRLTAALTSTQGDV